MIAASTARSDAMPAGKLGSMLRREVEIPEHRMAIPLCPLAAVAGILLLAIVTAGPGGPRQRSKTVDRTPVHTVRPCKERTIRPATPAADAAPNEYGVAGPAVQQPARYEGQHTTRIRRHAWR